MECLGAKPLLSPPPEAVTSEAEEHAEGLSPHNFGFIDRLKAGNTLPCF